MLGGLGGRTLGTMVGFGGEGANMGTSLGASLSRWLGSGDYDVTSNSLVRQAASGTVPSMHKNDQTITVRHKEFVTEVSGRTAFTVIRRFSINPGLVQTFPWLSTIAGQYSEYRIKGMVYHYVPTSGNAVASSNAALGTVMLQTSYRASESAPQSKVELLNEYWANESKPSEAFCHPIECNPKENPFNIQYVRTSSVASTDNVLLYDLGTTSLAVSGQQIDNAVLGDLWITYEIELRKPKLAGIVGETVATYFASGTSSVNTTTPFGSNAGTLVDESDSGMVVSPTALTVQPGNAGTYQMTLVYTSTTSFTFGSMAITGSGSVAYRVYGTTNPRTTTTTAGSGASVVYTFQVTDPNTTTVITPSVSTLVGAAGVYIHVTKINPLAYT